MAETTRVTVVLKMKWGPQAKFVFHVSSTIVAPNDPIITGLITVLEAITYGKAIGIEISLSAAAVASASSGVDYVSEDKGLFRFKDADGVTHSYKVPGIPFDILEDDVEVINPADPDVSDYTDAILANAKTQSGGAITSFVSGHRIENRKPIKAGRID